MKPQVSIRFGTCPALMAVRYLSIIMVYSLPVSAPELLSFIYLSEFRIYFLRAIVWETNSGLSSSAGTLSNDCSFCSSISGLTKVKQSLLAKDWLITFRIWTLEVSFRCSELNASSRYSDEVIDFPSPFINSREKSRITQSKEGRLEKF